MLLSWCEKQGLRQFLRRCFPCFSTERIVCTTSVLFPELGEKISAIELELLFRFHRYHDRVVRDRQTRVQLCLRKSEPRLIPAEVAQIAPERRKDAGPVDVVNRPYSIKTNIGDSLDVLVHVERRPGTALYRKSENSTVTART